MKKILIFLFFVSSLICSTLNSVNAQENEKGFSINPFFQEVTIEKDQERTQFNLEISNMTEAPAIFYLSALDFGALDESGGVAFLGAKNDFEKKYGLASWISLEKDALAVGPGEKQSIGVTIENKESLSPGGHYAAIVLKLENENSSAGGESEVNLKSSLAALIFVRKIGGEIEELSLKEKNISKDIFGFPEKAELRFQNTGNVHLIPRGVVKIIDPFGREIKKGIINSESSLILPETFRIFPLSIRKTMAALIPGRHTLEINYRYDGREAFETEQAEFFAVPPLFLIMIGVILISIYLSINREKIFRRKNEKNKNEKTRNKE